MADSSLLNGHARVAFAAQHDWSWIVTSTKTCPTRLKKEWCQDREREFETNMRWLSWPMQVPIQVQWWSKHLTQRAQSWQCLLRSSCHAPQNSHHLPGLGPSHQENCLHRGKAFMAGSPHRHFYFLWWWHSSKDEYFSKDDEILL